MKAKQKPCKAIGKALAPDVEGCGKMTYKRTYGLCDTCYKQWLYETPEGKEKQKQNLPKCKECGDRYQPFFNNTQQKHCMKKDACITAALELHTENKIKQAKRDKQKFHIDSMSKDQYRAKKIQPLINQLVRIIDKGQPCIASKVTKGKFAGGHYHAVGHDRTISLNLHNIHIQAFHSNGPQGGQHVKYRHGLIEVYGSQYAEYVDMKLCQCPVMLWTKEDLVNMRPILQKMVNHYKKKDLVYSTKERIELRNKLNTELGIYPEEYANYYGA